MDSITETEQPKPERIVKLGEEFQPFDPSYVTVEVDKNITDNVNKFRSLIQLDLGDKKIPFMIYTSPSLVSWGKSITPFNTELGYQIDSQDLNLEDRTQKYKRLMGKMTEKMYYQEAPLYLEIESEVQISEARDLDLLSRLRAYFLFPGSRVEGKPEESLSKSPRIHINNFYPIETGPLPENKRLWRILDEGFFLFLPSDPEKLAQIRARFVLAPEEPNEGGEN